MNYRVQKRRLSQAQRITGLKERRAELARIQAIRNEREARIAAAAAAARRKEARATSEKARSAFFELGGSIEAETWLIAQELSEQHAVEASEAAKDRLSAAKDTMLSARREHERLRERCLLIGKNVKVTDRKIAAQIQNREDDEMQERTR